MSTPFHPPHKNPAIKTISFFYRPDNEQAPAWEKKIAGWIRKHKPRVKIVEKNPQAVIVLGGDGAILEAARMYQKHNPIILGLNLGRVGFLASAREPKKFIGSMKEFLSGRYQTTERIMLEANVRRNRRSILKINSLNDVAIQNLLGVSEIEVEVERHKIQHIYGAGVLIATPTGSTAYNLSTHGPLVMPHMKCLIISELLDHNIPTPSIIVDNSKKITVKVIGFRKRGFLTLTETGKPVDMVLSDGATVFPLEKGDEIIIRQSPRIARFAELEKHYFFKSLQEKFAFK